MSVLDPRGSTESLDLVWQIELDSALKAWAAYERRHLFRECTHPLTTTQTHSLQVDASSRQITKNVIWSTSYLPVVPFFVVKIGPGVSRLPDTDNALKLLHDLLDLPSVMSDKNTRLSRVGHLDSISDEG